MQYRFFTAMGGISGAFLLLPFQMSVFGFTSPAVSATNQFFNVVAIPSGVWRYVKEGRMVWPLTWIVVLGTLPGVFAGALIRIIYLPDPTNFKLFAAIVLSYIGIRIARDLVKQFGTSDQKSSEARFQALVKSYRAHHDTTGQNLPATRVVGFSVRTLTYEFYGEQYSVPVPTILAVSVVVGVIGGIYGVGGGAIIAPFYVAFFGLPVYTVAGATLMGTFITSIAGVLSYQALAPFYPGMQVAPDWMLGVLFGIGGSAGMYCGARCQKFMPARFIKCILVGCLLFLSGKYALDYFKKSAG